MVKIKRTKVIEPIPTKSISKISKTYEILSLKFHNQEVKISNINYQPANGLHQSNDGGETIEQFNFDLVFASGRIKPGDELRNDDWAKIYVLFKYSFLTGFKNNQCFELNK